MVVKLLKIPITILLSLAIFVIVVFFFLQIFGSLNCDSFANSTAYYLKLAIDEVSQDNFPWGSNEIPKDPTYYKEVPIRLCQERGTSFWEAFFGAPPEYQIYYEVFPEGGVAWTEAYPWSGGAAGTIKMWIAIRLGTGFLKAIGKVTPASIATSFLKKIKGAFSKVKGSIVSKFRRPTELQAILVRLKEELGVEFLQKGRPGELLVEMLKKYEGDEIIEALKKAGFLAVDENGDVIVEKVGDKIRIVIKNTAKEGVEGIPLKVPIMDKYGNVIDEAQLYVKRVNGEIVDITTDASKIAEGYEEFKVNPAEVYKDYLDMINKEQKKYLESVYVVEGETQGIIDKIKNLPNKIRDTNWFRTYIKPVEERIKRFIKRIEFAGYRGRLTEGEPARIRGILDGLENRLDDDEIYHFFIEEPTIKEKIMTKFKLVSEEQIKKEHVYKFLNSLKKEMGGFIFIPKGLKWEIYEVAIDTVIDMAKNGENLLLDDIVSKISSVAPEIIDEFGEDAVRQVVDMDIIPALTGLEDDLARGSIDAEITFTARTFGGPGGYLDRVKNGLKGLTDGTIFKTKEDAAKELGLLIGVLEQNTATFPVTFKAAAANGIKKEFKKVVYLDGSALINPAGWYAQPFFIGSILSHCGGNSICLLNKNNLETPFYLNKSADKFFIRVWRPVEAWKQWAGIQAAIMHVPQHPRFYVVSPCFAIAKVWKTIYNGEPTIFIYPEKKETPGSSNYCYADSNLINQYVAIWAISDILSFMPWSSFLGKLGLAEKLTKTVDKIIGIADPVTLAQGILEGAISWPGYPFAPLTYEDIVRATPSVSQELLHKTE